MASRLRVFPPMGKPMTVYYSEGQDKQQIAHDILLERWEEYCNNNWISPDDRGSDTPENRVKLFLDSVGYLLLRDNPEDTVSTYKELRTGRSEIPVSSCPGCINDALYGDGGDLREKGGMTGTEFTEMCAALDEKTKRWDRPKKRKPKPETRFDRIERIRKALPGCRFSFCRVDTENRFEYNGIWYRIADTVTAYQPTEVKGEQAFAMDEIIAVLDRDRKLHFYDQNAHRLDREDIGFA